MNTPIRREGVTLRQAAVIAGLCYLMPVSYAEFAIWPKLIVHGQIAQTVQNISLHPRLFAIGILCNLFTLVEDVVIAWAFYILLAPVNRSLSLLTAWFRLVYTVIALFAVLNLVTVFHMLTMPGYAGLVAPAQLDAQVFLLLRSFRTDWSFSLILFGIHLALLGWLIYQSGYIPRILGGLVALDGLGWLAASLQPYLYPGVDLGFLMPLSFVELLLPIWLLLRGWKIADVEASA